MATAPLLPRGPKPLPRGGAIGAGGRPAAASRRRMFSLLAALVFHHDWSQTSEYLLFISDVAVAGGLLVLAQAGTPGLSLDARRQRRAGRF